MATVKQVRNALDKVFETSKKYFFENVWPTIPQEIKDQVQQYTEYNNTKFSYQIVLYEVWRYLTMYLNVYGLPGMDEFIDKTFRIQK